LKSLGSIGLREESERLVMTNSYTPHRAPYGYDVWSAVEVIVDIFVQPFVDAREMGKLKRSGAFDLIEKNTSGC
jgi:hypothetical protein